MSSNNLVITDKVYGLIGSSLVFIRICKAFPSVRKIFVSSSNNDKQTCRQTAGLYIHNINNLNFCACKYKLLIEIPG